MIHFTKANWESFFTKGKKTTIRIKNKKYGVHPVIVGRKVVGSIEVLGSERKLVKDLNEEDARNDGFACLAELLLELGKLNHAIHWDTEVFILTCINAKQY